MKELRQARLGDEMRRILADLIRLEVKDPRIPMMTSLTEVKVSGDMAHAKCYVSVMGSAEERAEALKALRKAQGFLRTELAKRMRLRICPELSFLPDDSIEQGLRMDELIDKAMGRERD